MRCLSRTVAKVDSIVIWSCLDPKISDAEVLTLAVMQALLGYTSETRWLRYARANLLPMFGTLPRQSGYNKRLRSLAPTMS